MPRVKPQAYEASEQKLASGIITLVIHESRFIRQTCQLIRLCALTLSAICISATDMFINSLVFERVTHETSRND